MPFVNSQGRIAHGRLLAGAWLDNVQFDTGGEACWYNNDTIVYIHDGPDGRYLAFYDVNTQVITPVDAPPRRRVDMLMANKNAHWAAWKPDIGLISDTGFNSPTALLQAIGPGGAIVYRATDCIVHEPTGNEYLLSENITEDVALLAEGQAIWVEGGAIKSLGLPPLKVVGTDASGLSEPLAVVMGDKWWLCYRSTTHGVVLHPSDEVKGYLLPGSDRFDIIAMSATSIRYAYGNSGNEDGANGVSYMDIDITTSPPTLDLGMEIPGVEDDVPVVDDLNMMTLTSSATFDVVAAAEELVAIKLEVYPTFPQENGRGRLIHPTLGAFDYEVKPDEWVNIDADAIITPVWASSRTLTGSANVLWAGNLRDVVVEERWKAIGGLAMPVTQMRMLLAIWTTPIDPDVGYVQWFPNYITRLGFKVLPVNLSAGQGITFDDVVNYKDEDGEPIGWMTNPVTFTMKLVERL